MNQEGSALGYFSQPSNASTATHALGTNSISFFEKSVIQEARRKLLQSNQNLLSAIDLSNSPQSLQMTPDNRRIAPGSGRLDDSGQKSVITVSSLIRTPVSNKISNLNQHYHQNMNFAEMQNQFNRYNLAEQGYRRKSLKLIYSLFGTYLI